MIGGYSRWHDAAEEKLRQLRFLESPVGINYIHRFEQSLNSRHRSTERKPVGLMWQILRETLTQGDPVYVSHDVADMIDHARDAFEPEPVLRTDPFAPCGFAYFPRPVMLPEAGRWVDEGQPAMIPVRAIGWMPMYASDEDPDTGCFWVSYFTSAEDDIACGRGLDSRQMSPHATLLLVHIFQWTFGDAPWKHPDEWLSDIVNEWDRDDAIARGRAQTSLVQVMWRLGSQVLRDPLRMPRPLRREHARYGLPHDDVTVIRLRREPIDGYDEDGGEVDWRCRWLVRGHWRRITDKEGHPRQVWVNPYVKGPEDKPLKVTSRVFEFVR